MTTYDETHVPSTLAHYASLGITPAGLDYFVQETLIQQADVASDAWEDWLDSELPRQVAAIREQGMAVQLLMLHDGWDLDEAAQDIADIAAFITGRLDIWPIWLS